MLGNDRLTRPSVLALHLREPVMQRREAFVDAQVVQAAGRTTGRNGNGVAHHDLYVTRPEPRHARMVHLQVVDDQHVAGLPGKDRRMLPHSAAQ